MVSVLVGVSIAALLTSLFAFRFDAGRKRWLLAGYFTLFLVIERVATHFFLPADALGIEVAAVCFGLALLFAMATEYRQRKEAEARGSESEDASSGAGRRHG
jgi:hypothetical protein